MVPEGREKYVMNTQTHNTNTGINTHHQSCFLLAPKPSIRLYSALIFGQRYPISKKSIKSTNVCIPVIQSFWKLRKMI